MERQHHGIARLSIEGDAAAGQVYIGRAQQLLQTLLDRLRAGGLSTGAAALRLDDNAYAYARVAGSINAIRIVVGSKIDDVEEELTIPLGAPDFVSGIVTNGRIKTAYDGGRPFQYAAAFYPTARTALTHRDLTPNEPQGMERLAVSPHSSHSEWQAPENSQYPFSQYVRCRATLYSGRMKRVVQALMGFGRQLPGESKDGTPIEAEETVNPSRTRSVYARVLSKMADEREGKQQPTQYERDVATSGLQIRYDYRFMRTHGIHLAIDGELWLVEIGMTRGVLAMPLPLHELTRRPPPPKPGEDPQPWKFRNALEELEVETGDPDNPFVTVHDEDGIRMLDEFGGFPTGESIPTGDTLQSAIRAGEVLELASVEDLEPFYRHSYYSSSMGWAFSDSGKEAHNTGYRFEEGGIGYQIGAHYALSIDISAMRRDAPLPGAEQIARRVESLSADPQKKPILRRKALRLSSVQILKLSSSALTDEEFIDEMDEMEVTPIATGSAVLRQQREGYLVNPGKNPENQIKFFEPLFGYLLSHDFRPANGDDLPPARRCDTPMHVFFSGDEFKWVRYFYDPQSTPSQSDDDQEQCMYHGSWSRTVTTGPCAVTRGYYTSDFDDRTLLGASRSTTHWKGEYIGATRIMVYDDPSDFRRNYASRIHSFIMTTDTTNVSGQKVLTSIAVPQGLREAYYMAHMDYAESYSHSISRGYRELTDPWMAEGWRCIISTAGFATWPSDMRECPPGCDTRYNMMGFQGVEGYFAMQPRVARYVRYQPYTCSDIVDKGPWVQKCDNLDSLKYNIELPDLPPTENEIIPRKARLDIRLVMSVGPLNVTTRIANYSGAAWALPRWFQRSPDDFGFVDFIAAGGNALGDSAAAVVDRDLNLVAGPLLHGFPAYEGMDGSNACYIGVV